MGKKPKYSFIDGAAARLMLFLVMLCLLPAGADAEFFCRRHDFASGESALQNHISNVQQDSAGFMWFATWNGLVRFDGQRFHVFQPILCSDGTIFSNRIYNIRVSSTGDLWCVSSDNRLFHFDRSLMRFTDLQTVIPEIADKKVKVITPLKNGATWVIFKDFTAIRLADGDPSGGWRYLDRESAELAGSKKINAVCRTEMGDEWVLTDREAVNLTTGRRVVGDFRSTNSIGATTILLGHDGEAVTVGSDGKIRSKAQCGGGSVTYSLVMDGRIFVASDRGVRSLEPRSGKVTAYTETPTAYLFKDSKRRIWAFGNDGGVRLIDAPDRGEAKTVVQAKPSGVKLIKNPQLIFEKGSGEIILCPAGGALSYFDEQTGRVEKCRFHLNNDVADYTPDDIKKYLVDHQDNLWIFNEHGAECINFSRNYFNHLSNSGLTETRAVAHDSGGRLWTGDRGNRIQITGRDGRISYLRPDGSLTDNPAGFSMQPAYCIRTAPDSSLWIGTKGDGLYRVAPRAKAVFDVEHYRAGDPVRPIPTDTVYDIAFAGGSVWLGSYGNGLSFGRRIGGGYRFEKVRNQPPGMKIRSITDCGDGVLLLATADGLVSADVRNIQSPRFFVNRYRKEDDALKGNDIMGAFKCGDSYYVCVFGSGISRIDSENLLSDDLRFTNFPIPSSAIAGQIKTAAVYKDDIWLISEKSVSRFSTGSGLYTIYSGDSFTGRFSLSEAAPAIADGTVTAGTTDGIISFSPERLTVDIAPVSPIVVTGIRYQNDAEMRPLNDLDSLELTPDRRSFSLSLSSMNYGGAFPPRFRYRLENYDQGWNYASEQQPAVIYNNLPPGGYTLVIQTSEPDGSWQKEERRISLAVLPRFTERPLFRLLVALLCIAGVCALAYAAVYFMRMRNEIQKKYSLLMSIDQMSRNCGPDSGQEPEAESQEEKNRSFIAACVEFLTANLDNPDLMVEDLARSVGMSRTACYNRMKQITGLSPVDFIKQMRIKKALRLLDGEGMSISDVAYSVGFTDPKYFSKCFKAEMGVTPSVYQKNRRQDSGEK